MHVVRLKRAKTDANLGRLHGSLRQGRKNQSSSVSLSLFVSSHPTRARAVGFRTPRASTSAPPRAIERKNNTHRARRGVSPPPAPARDASTSRAPSPPSRPGSRRMTNPRAHAPLAPSSREVWSANEREIIFHVSLPVRDERRRRRRRRAFERAPSLDVTRGFRELARAARAPSRAIAPVPRGARR